MAVAELRVNPSLEKGRRNRVERFGSKKDMAPRERERLLLSDPLSRYST